MVDTTSACGRFGNRPESDTTAFPPRPFFQNGPRRPGFASPRLMARPGQLRAVLNKLSIRRESPFGKQPLAFSRPRCSATDKLDGPIGNSTISQCEHGAERQDELSPGLSSVEKYFLLDISSHRTRRASAASSSMRDHSPVAANFQTSSPAQ